MYQLLCGVYLTDANGVVQHCLGVSGVVTAGQLGVAEVSLQQQVGLGVGTVKGVGVDLQRELLSQLAVQLVLVVSVRQLCILLRLLEEIRLGTTSLKPSACSSWFFCFYPRLDGWLPTSESVHQAC